MAGQLIPSPEMAAPVGNDLSPAQRVQLWVQLMATCDDLLRAGLLHTLHDEDGLREAYRQWYEAELVNHDRMILRLAERLREASPNAS